MEFKDAVKLLRVELNLTQGELAEALHITSLTVGRWERGLNQPNRAAVSLLLGFARVKGASAACIEKLRLSSGSISKRRLDTAAEHAASAEAFSFRQLIDDAFFPVYICDLETDELLYLNRAAQQAFGLGRENFDGKACFEALMHRGCPCEHCDKRGLDWNRFVESGIYTALDGFVHPVHSKLVSWSGRPAQVHYVMCAER